MRIRARRGISPVIAVLIMVAAAISLGSFAYWYTISYAKASSQAASLIVDATAVASGTKSSLQVTFKNTGTTSITIERILVSHDGGSFWHSVDKDVAAGATYSVTVSSDEVPSLSFTPGRSYGLIVETSMGNVTSIALCVGG